jgi:hypothetical protein
MIILNLFIDIILNSMSEIHAEITEGDRKQTSRQVDQPILIRQPDVLERELQTLRERVRKIRLANTFDKPGEFQS